MSDLEETPPADYDDGDVEESEIDPDPELLEETVTDDTVSNDG
jgi:hypothetical protein